MNLLSSIPMAVHYRLLTILAEKGAMSYESVKHFLERHNPNDLPYLASSICTLINAGKITLIGGYEDHNILYAISSKEMTDLNL